MSRQVRTRRPRGRSRVGERFEVEIGPIAHGGHCVARVPDADAQRVVFVRHGLPGERAVIELTDGNDGDRFWRADVVEVRAPSADRVTAPCPVSGPGACGGCDFQHVALPAQRELKTQVLREQLRRIAHLDSGLAAEVVVEPVPGDQDGLRWRTRQNYVVDPATGKRSMRRYRSHDLIPVDDCLIAAHDARGPGPGTVRESVTVDGVTHDFTVSARGFWQVHPAAPSTLVGEVLRMLDPAAGESVLDLYAGVGLFSAFLANRVGPTGRVVAVEGDRTASELSLDNVPGLEARAGDVATVLADAFAGRFDLVVLDPPREGAKRAVVDQVVGRMPRAVAYVACDPAALARDIALFAEAGYELVDLRAFDLFPMTHHVECVALLTKTASDLR